MSTTRTRKRTADLDLGTITHGFMYGDSVLFQSSLATHSVDRQLTVDETCTDMINRREVRRILSRPQTLANLSPEQVNNFREIADSADVGGAFLSLRTQVYVDAPTTRLYYDMGGYGPFRAGPLVPDVVMGYLDQPFLTPVSQETLFQKGSQAIARCRPLKSKASTAVFLGELKSEGLPKIESQLLNRRRLSGLADDWLSLNFEVMPFLSDLDQMVQAFERSDALWAQIQRDAGRRIRRRYAFPVVESHAYNVLEANQSFPAGVGHTLLYPESGPCLGLHHMEHTRSQFWFSGAFRYALPPVGSRWDRFRREARRWRSVYGLTVDPQVLYNLTPWTWLADWFFDLQPLLGWVSSSLFDDLVMQYGYVMVEQYQRHEWAGTYHTINGDFPVAAACIRTSKQRAKASPFGFGIVEEDLTPRQLSLLAALGITRARSLAGS